MTHVIFDIDNDMMELLIFLADECGYPSVEAFIADAVNHRVGQELLRLDYAAMPEPVRESLAQHFAFCFQEHKPC